MNIDINKVNLSERDIEDWLWAHPQAIRTRHGNDGMVDRWIARQYRLPNGIADLIGIAPDGLPIVVEVKNVPINKAAVLQVCRYASDIDHIIGWKTIIEAKAHRLLVGPSIDFQTEHEAWACNVRCLIFTCNLNLTLGYRDDQAEYERYYGQCSDLAERPEWQMWGHEPPAYQARPKDKYDELMDAIAADEELSDGDE